MKRLNITKERFERSRYFTRKYGRLEYVSESGRVYKTSKGNLLKFSENTISESEGDNEASVAQFVFQCLKNSHPDSTGILVRSLKKNDAVDFNGNKVSVKDANPNFGSLNDYGKEGARAATKKSLKYNDDERASSKISHRGHSSYKSKLEAIIDSMHYTYGVFQLGSLGLPGDVAVVTTNATIGETRRNVSVIEVKSNSLGRRMFNPTFKMQNGVLIPVGRYANMWTDDVLADINEAIEDNDGDPNITGIPLNCDFSDFVQNYSTRNPFGPIEYVALGFGDEGITFYKVVEEPNMEIYGTG